MFWSSIGEHGYTVGLAESKNGRLDGEWVQHAKPFFTENGGHCCLFNDFDGILRMALHQSNNPPDERIKILTIVDDGDGMPRPAL